MIGTSQAFLIMAVVAVCTFITRVLPFALFGRKDPPEWVLYLGRILPPAVIAIMVVYCYRNVTLNVWPFGLPEFIAMAAVVALHVWKRNNLISIGVGTVLYMVLIQVVFV